MVLKVRTPWLSRVILDIFPTSPQHDHIIIYKLKLPKLDYISSIIDWSWFYDGGIKGSLIYLVPQYILVSGGEQVLWHIASPSRDGISSRLILSRLSLSCLPFNGSNNGLVNFFPQSILHTIHAQLRGHLYHSALDWFQNATRKTITPSFWKYYQIF